MTEPNTSNRCNSPEDANWAAPFQFGKWAWDAQLFDAPVSGPGLTLIDATYSYGFGRLRGELPPNTFGGFPSDYYSTAYNAGYGSWGLASTHHRDQGIVSYEFMIANDQSGPYSWWESSSAPRPRPRGPGSTRPTGSGFLPPRLGHVRSEQSLVGLTRGREVRWHPDRGPRCAGPVAAFGPVDVGHQFPDHQRSEARHQDLVHRHIGVLDPERSTAVGTGALPAAVPFVGNIAGTFNRRTGTVTLAPHTSRVTVRLRVAVPG